MPTWRETWLVYRRQMRRQMRVPIWIAIGVIQPVLYLTLFAPLLKRVVAPGSVASYDGSAWQFFVPGLLVQLALFGTAFSGFGIIDELRSGIIERMRVSPMSRASMILGRVLKDVTVLLVQASILVSLSLLYGLRAPWYGIVAAFGVMALLGMALAALSYSAGLTFKDEGALAAMINFFTLPLLLLSGVLLPMTLAPGWLHDLSRANPLLYVVDGSRSMFRGDWGASHLPIGIACAAAIAAVAMVIGTRTFRSDQS
jgi:ABC-2 type transport system permease protein